MPQNSDRRTPASVYSKVELPHAVTHPPTSHAYLQHEEQSSLLRDVLSSQDRTNELLEEILAMMSANQRQRATELSQWKQANPRLARSCQKAAESLAQVQVAFLNAMTDEINDTSDDLLDGEYVLSEFVDRFGPRLAHLNGVIQVLAQLSSVPNATDAQP